MSHMDGPSGRRPGAFAPIPASPILPPPPIITRQRDRSLSNISTTSSGSAEMATNSGKRQPGPYSRPTGPANASTSSLNLASSLNFSRPSISQVFSDQTARRGSPLNPATDPKSHRRNNSQGFFEPSLPSAGLPADPGTSSRTASHIAAQAAFLQRPPAPSQVHSRQRSITVPHPQGLQPPSNLRLASTNAGGLAPIVNTTGLRRPSATSSDGMSDGARSPGSLAAANAASAAYPSYGLPVPKAPSPPISISTEKDAKSRLERSKLKLFSKPKHISIPTFKESEKKGKGVDSGISQAGTLGRYGSASTTNLLDSSASNNSMYMLGNNSTSTITPSSAQKNKDDEKSHRHHFLSRQKNKLKDRLEDKPVEFSSSSSNSKLVDPNALGSIYSFTPPSPSTATTFSKSVSGLDLRHGGKALRERRREEKERERLQADSASLYAPTITAGASNINTPGIFGLESAGGSLSGFGVSELAVEDAWDFLKAKLLVAFEGEELRLPIEDLNRLVIAHLQLCVRRRAPLNMIEDIRDLLETGFSSLEQTLNYIHEDRLILHLVEMWLFVFSTIVPYMQAVFLPLDLEFKGRGTCMNQKEASEFWGIDLENDEDHENELEVRRMVLQMFRDKVLLNRYMAVKAVFSRMSLANINVGPDYSIRVVPPRPGTAGSLDPGLSSYNSQSSTLLGDGNRSRATSNTSAPELPSFNSYSSERDRERQVDDGSTARLNYAESSIVTETVGRMLQCMYVMVSLQTGDDAQNKVEELTKTLKLNFMGSTRTGRNRKGFVGARLPTSTRGMSIIGAAA